MVETDSLERLLKQCECQEDNDDGDNHPHGGDVIEIGTQQSFTTIVNFSGQDSGLRDNHDEEYEVVSQLTTTVDFEDDDDDFDNGLVRPGKDGERLTTNQGPSATAGNGILIPQECVDEEDFSEDGIDIPHTKEDEEDNNESEGEGEEAISSESFMQESRSLNHEAYPRCVAKIVVVAVVVLAAITLTVMVYSNSSSRWVPLLSPKQDMREFVLAEIQRNDDNDLSLIEDLETETFKSYAGAYCLEANGLETARSALAAGLASAPQAVRDRVAEIALQDGISAQNTLSDFSADLDNSHQAHSFMIFYPSKYESQRDGTDTYKTCVLVTGLTFTIAEHVASFKEIEEEYVVGNRLDCGFWACSRIPKYGKRIVRTPVFKRTALSLKKQKDLHTWMVQQAIGSASNLLGLAPPRIGKQQHHDQYESIPPTKDPEPSTSAVEWDWEAPNYEYEL